MNISIAPEAIFHLFGYTITNSIMTAWIISLVLIITAIVINLRMSKVPRRGQNVFEVAYEGLFSMTEKAIGRTDVATELFPFIIVAFLFIILSNWSGLLPGFGGSIGVHQAGELVPLFRSPTSDLNTVIALAIISVSYVQYMGIKYRGAKSYLGTFFNFSSPIFFFVGIIELVSEFTRIISYSFRLFGNIFAGEVLITVIFYLTATFLPFIPILPIPFFVLEMFVGLIQAFVFCFLTIVFTGIAVADHGNGHAEPTEAAVITTA